MLDGRTLRNGGVASGVIRACDARRTPLYREYGDQRGLEALLREFCDARRLPPCRVGWGGSVYLP
jgi:hypothetical protein